MIRMVVHWIYPVDPVNPVKNWLFGCGAAALGFIRVQSVV